MIAQLQTEHSLRQPTLDWIIELHFAFDHHIGEQQRGESFCDRTDFKQGVGRDRVGLIERRVAVRHDAHIGALGNHHRDADGLFVDVDSLRQDFLHPCVGGLPEDGRNAQKRERGT